MVKEYLLINRLGQCLPGDAILGNANLARNVTANLLLQAFSLLSTVNISIVTMTVFSFDVLRFWFSTERRMLLLLCC